MQIKGKNQSARRGFLKASTVGAMGAVGAMTMPVLLANANQSNIIALDKQEATTASRHRFQHLELHTATPLPEMAAFYKNVLEMEVQLGEEILTINGGETQITFTPAESGTNPYYHFAFNIPENKIISARNWLADRTTLSITPAGARENGLPDDIRPFNHWNSHSVFFWDPAGNILELICRHDLKNGTKGEFRSDEILYASEIGFVAEGSVSHWASQIRSTFQLPQYRGGGDSFRAIGDETGLFVLFRQGGTPVGAKDNQRWQVFPTNVTVQPELVLESETLPHSIRTG